jgi:hypothetical protein
MHWTSRLSRSSQIVLAMCLTLTLLGCEDNKPPIGPGTGDQIDDVEEVRRFYPMQIGDTRNYIVTGGTEFIYEVIDVVDKTSGPETTIEVTSEGVTHLEYMRWSDTNLLSSLFEDHTSEQMELSGPLYASREWRKVNNTTESNIFYIDCEILDMAYPITVEAGTYEAMVVQEIKHSQFIPLPMSIDTAYVYYAQDVGVIRWDLGGILYDLQQFVPGEGEITSVLE